MFKWLAKVTVELLAELTPKSPAPGCPSEMQGQVIWVAPLRDYQKLSAPEVKVKVKSCPTLSDPTDCSLPGSCIHGILQARVLEWGATAFSEKGS